MIPRTLHYIIDETFQLNETEIRGAASRCGYAVEVWDANELRELFRDMIRTSTESLHELQLRDCLKLFVLCYEGGITVDPEYVPSAALPNQVFETNTDVFAISHRDTGVKWGVCPWFFASPGGSLAMLDFMLKLARPLRRRHDQYPLLREQLVHNALNKIYVHRAVPMTVVDARKFFRSIIELPIHREVFAHGRKVS